METYAKERPQISSFINERMVEISEIVNKNYQKL